MSGMGRAVAVVIVAALAYFTRGCWPFEIPVGGLP